jgi:hypothetical protein
MSLARSRFPSTGAIEQTLLGLLFLGAVAMLSFPAARGAGPLGWMPLWLVGMPLASLAAACALRLRPAPVLVAAVPRARARRRQAVSRRATASARRLRLPRAA